MLCQPAAQPVLHEFLFDEHGRNEEVHGRAGVRNGAVHPEGGAALEGAGHQPRGVHHGLGAHHLLQGAAPGPLGPCVGHGLPRGRNIRLPDCLGRHQTLLRCFGFGQF